MRSLLRPGVALCGALGSLAVALMVAGPAFAHDDRRSRAQPGGVAEPPQVDLPTPRHLLRQAMPLTTHSPPVEPTVSASPSQRKYADGAGPVSPVSPSSPGAPVLAPDLAPGGAGAAPTAPPATAATSLDPAAQVVARVNGVRAANGLPPYAPLPGLAASARLHDLTMAAGCGLSHQCAREAVFSDRITAQRVPWRSAGENVGTGKPVANDPAAIAAMALRLTDIMFAEVPPNDGHRRNLLSTGFRYIGVDVYRDPAGAVWMTQDLTG